MVMLTYLHAALIFQLIDNARGPVAMTGSQLTGSADAARLLWACACRHLYRSRSVR